MRSHSLLLSSLLVVLLLARSADAQTLATRQALDTLRARYHLPALVAAIVQPEAIYYLGGGARHNDQPTEAITLDDYFHLGSETKSVTSLLAGKLVEEDKLKWKSKLLDVVPELKANARPEYADITLDKLLSH
jgi:CubicO group peptidase (beta-lactamase class C family)